MDKKTQIKVKVKPENSGKEKIGSPKAKPVKDGPEIRDIKENKGKKKFLKPKSSRIIKLGKNKKESQEKEKSQPKKSRLIYFLISIIFILFVSAGAYLGYLYINKDKIIKIIPQNTVFYARLNINHLLKSYEDGKINSLISKFLPKQLLEIGTSDYLDNSIFDQYGLSFSKDIKPLLKDEIALTTLLVNYKNKEILTTAAIAEVKGTENINNLFSQSPAFNSTEENLYEGVVIYLEIFDESNLNFYHASLDNFIVLSKNINSIKEIINVQKGKQPSLNQSSRYKQTVPFLTRLNFLYSYIDFSEVSFDAFLNNKSMDFKFKDFFSLYVFLKNIETLSLHAEARDNSIVLHGFTPYKSENTKPANPSEFIPINALGSLSGNNLKEDFDTYLSLLENENPALNSSFAEYKEILIKEYNIDINNDIYPFFENNTEIIIMPSQNKSEMVFVLNKGENSRESIEKIEDAISHYYGLINPKKEAFTLADGSLAYELFPDTDSFAFEESKFNNSIIRSINNPDVHTEFSYAIIDNIIIFGTSKDAIEEVISTKSENTGLVLQSEFEESLSLNNSQNVNSLLYLNLTKVFEKIGLTKEQSAYLNLKNFILTSRNDFNGTSITGSLLIK